MFKSLRKRASLMIVLAVLSIIMYGIHYKIFGNAKETASNIVLSLAFVPIGIFYNILIIDKILEAREKIKIANKINIIVGAFYSEVGTKVLTELIKGDLTISEITMCSKITKHWTNESFKLLKETVESYDCELDINLMDLNNLNRILDEKDDFILSLISSPMLEEYDEFTDMLISLYHVRDELRTRLIEGEIKEYEKAHLRKDICRAYLKIIIQWVDYMEHLKLYYPSLFIKALITSPFDDRTLQEKDKEYLELKDDEME
ncbi:MAG: hypothetical protein ACRC7N_19865 [Clostridium sp.]